MQSKFAMHRLNISRAEGSRGFSLVELLTVVAIIGVLATIAIPAYVKYINKAKIVAAESTLETLRTDIEAFYVNYAEYPVPPVDFITTGLDGKGRSVVLPDMISQIRKDLFSFDSYVIADSTYIVTVKANDDRHTVMTLTQQGIMR